MILLCLFGVATAQGQCTVRGGALPLFGWKYDCFLFPFFISLSFLLNFSLSLFMNFSLPSLLPSLYFPPSSLPPFLPSSLPPFLPSSLLPLLPRGRLSRATSCLFHSWRWMKITELWSPNLVIQLGSLLAELIQEVCSLDRLVQDLQYKFKHRCRC